MIIKILLTLYIFPIMLFSFDPTILFTIYNSKKVIHMRIIYLLYNILMNIIILWISIFENNNNLVFSLLLLLFYQYIVIVKTKELNSFSLLYRFLFISYLIILIYFL